MLGFGAGQRELVTFLEAPNGLLMHERRRVGVDRPLELHFLLVVPRLRLEILDLRREQMMLLHQDAPTVLLAFQQIEELPILVAKSSQPLLERTGDRRPHRFHQASSSLDGFLAGLASGGKDESRESDGEDVLAKAALAATAPPKQDGPTTRGARQRASTESTDKNFVSEQ